MKSSIIVKMLVKDIIWDTDGDETALKELPKSVSVDIELADIQSFNCINHQICEYLSEEYGWLIGGYKLEGYSE